MLKSDNLEFERGAAAKTKIKIDKTAKRITTIDRDGTAGSRKSPAPLSPVDILSKDRWPQNWRWQSGEWACARKI